MISPSRALSTISSPLHGKQVVFYISLFTPREDASHAILRRLDEAGHFAFDLQGLRNHAAEAIEALLLTGKVEFSLKKPGDKAFFKVVISAQEIRSPGRWPDPEVGCAWRFWRSSLRRARDVGEGVE